LAINDDSLSREKAAAHFGRYINELGNEWCQRDINNPTFERDDSLFRKIVNTFNKDKKRDAIVAPALDFTSYYLYGDELVENSTTVNRFVHDDSSSLTDKASALDRVLTFLEYQLTESPSVRSDQGQKKYIVHADSHLGNYLITKDTEQTISVIDRRMPLVVGEAHRSAAAAMYRGDSESFFGNFIEAVSEDNKLTSPSQKLALARDVLFAIATQSGIDAEKEYQTITTSVVNQTPQQAPKQSVFKKLTSLPTKFRQLQTLRKDEEFAKRGLRGIGAAQAYGAELQAELEKLQLFGKAIIGKGDNTLKDPMAMRKVVSDALAKKGLSISLDMDLLLRIPAMMNHLKEQRQKLAA
jgi:hypothetical protein